ncbi:hypothetical protein GCM10010208_13570 [Actinomadura livida]|nr:hypothetical protein GCM10010208_13570 [Actinomadura livida]
MSAEEDGRGDDSRERRGDNGGRNTPPRRGSGARGRPGGSGDRRSGGPRQGSPRAGGAPGGRGRPNGGGWKGKDRDARGQRDDRKPGRPFKRADDRRTESRERRPDDRREGRPAGPRGERSEGRFDGPRGGERREGRPPASRGGPRPARSGGPGREGRPGGRQAGSGQGERRFQDRDGRDGRDGRGGRGGRDERRAGGRRFEGRREGRPGDRDRPFKGRGGPKRPQDGGGRPSGPRGDRPDRRTRTDERERPAPKHDDPILPDDVTGEELDVDARTELRTLPKELATKVARHLVMAGRLADEEPERAYKHARAARRLASRVGVVREAAGIAAYHAGEWAEALAELRAARRLSAGDVSYLPVMVDCERGLGRPERALDLIKSPEAKNLDPMGLVELRIVESGVRRDLGQYDAAVVTLQIPELRDRRLRPWSARLFYAYADALAEAGRAEEASDWFARAAAADRDGETDAAERYAELEGLHIIDTVDGDVEDAGAEEIDTGEGSLEDGGDVVTEDEAVPGDVAAAEGAPATGIEFKAADPEVPETPEEDVPDVPAVFLEPKPADGEQPPHTG